MCKTRTFIILILTLLNAPANAGIMSSLNDMFMSNTTATGTIHTKDRTGAFGGSVRMRTPVQGATIVTFDPPRLDAGCAGVDLFGGSFTFINSSALVDLFRKVAANAVGLAFQAAIDAISPSLSKLMSQFQTMVQRLNELAKNSCNLAHLIVDPLDTALSGDAVTNSIKNNQTTDWQSNLDDYLADANSTINRMAHINPKAGNGVAKGILASGSTALLGIVGLPNIDGSADDATNPNSLNARVMISLLGFKISGVDCEIHNQNGNTTAALQVAQQGTSSLTQKTCVGESTLTLDRLIKGGGAGSADPDGQLFMWECVNPAGSNPGAGLINNDDQKCTKMKKSLFNYQGIKGYVNNMLFGVADIAGNDPTNTSIVGKFNAASTATLSADQVKFVQQSGTPLLRLLSKTADPNMRIGIASMLEPYITSCIAAKVGDALYRAANDITGVGGYTYPDSMHERISDLKNDFIAHQNSCNKREQLMAVMQQLNMATNLASDNIR